MECVRPSAPGRTTFEKEQMSVFPGIIGNLCHVISKEGIRPMMRE